jgi:carboxymethylenebutenolidase
MDTQTTTVDVQVDGQPMAVFVARPTSSQNAPGIVIAYEGFGMTNYIQEVAEALAADGYIVAVPDLYHRVGRLLSVPYTEYDDAAQADRAVPLGSRRLMATVSDPESTRDLQAALAYVRGLPEARADTVGALGFWNGGRLAYLLACRQPDVKAVVSFYGHIVPMGASEKRPDSLLELTDRLQAAALLLWGKDGQPQTLDEVHTLEQRLQSLGKEFQSKVYPAPRGFHNPNVTMYDTTSAQDAWQRTRDWFAEHLGSRTSTGAQ